MIALQWYILFRLQVIKFKRQTLVRHSQVDYLYVIIGQVYPKKAVGENESFTLDLFKQIISGCCCMYMIFIFHSVNSEKDEHIYFVHMLNKYIYNICVIHVTYWKPKALFSLVRSEEFSYTI